MNQPFRVQHGHLFSDEGSVDDALEIVRSAKDPRVHADALQRLRALARKKGKGYQTLLKEFVIERLYEEEKREGLVG